MVSTTRDPVLLVDDDVEWTKELRNGLHDEGLFVVDVCHTKKDGLVRGVEKKDVFRAAIIDLNLDDSKPVLEGLDLILKLQDAQCRYPIIVSSAYSDPSTRVRAFEMGAINFLRRPYEDKNLFFDELTCALMSAIHLVFGPRPDKEPAPVDGGVPPHLRPTRRGPITLRPDGRFLVGTAELKLTKTERRIFAVLMLRPSFVPIDELSRRAGYTGDYLHNMISRTRKKVENLVALSKGIEDLSPESAVGEFGINPIEQDDDLGYRIAWPRS